jgi:protein tyrosine phosphatase (PTP) superfamily phosphohydrolase (DUF442 family)
MAEIVNFLQVSPGLACSGQPDESQLAKIAADGFKVVINLGLSTGKYALADEAASVIRLGLQYYQIPVIFDSPKLADLASFLVIMNKHRDNPTLVHCAVNYRASAFTGLFLFAASTLSHEELATFITQIWKPDPVWEQFIEDAVEYIKKTHIFNLP